MCGLVLAGCGKKPGTQMFTYVKKDDATIEITGFTDAAKEQSSFIIPTEIDGIKVTSVARESFRDCANIKEISIAEGVETIGENAFLGCYNLETINFPSTIESVGTNVVKNTIWEKNEYEQYGAVIINNILSSVQNVQSEYKLPDGIKKIASGVFYGNTQLTKIDMGSSLEEIGTYAFAGCTGITELRIPSSVKNIGYGAFSQCTNLTVSVPDTVGQVGQEAFYKVKFVEYKGKLGGAYWGAAAGGTEKQ